MKNAAHPPDPKDEADGAGRRIRARRLAKGIRQLDLAKAAGISPSYLNLIEAGRRRIGGALLGRLAEALDVPISELGEGPPDELLAALRSLPGAEAAEAEEPASAFAARRPQWARAAARAEARARSAAARAQALADRLAHDPRVSGALHEVVDAAAAVRSSAAILRDDTLDDNWRRRFVRNVGEDADRLAAGAATLTDWLERSAGEAGEGAEEAAWGWIAAQGDLDAILRDGWRARLADVPPASRRAARLVSLRMETLAVEARAVPEVPPGDPAQIAARLGVSMPLVLRRIAILGRAEGRGLVWIDGTGHPLLILAPPGFPVPRPGTACGTWPIHGLAPGDAVRSVCAVQGPRGDRFACTAAAVADRPDGIGGAVRLDAAMLIERAGSDAPDRTIGAGCPLCSATECALRREPAAIATL